MVSSGLVKTEGDELYYEVRGEGEPLLMIPGGNGDAGFYTSVADILADEFRVITYDRRGNSRSTRNEPKNFEVSQQARDAVAVLEAVGHPSAYVFGNSGGAIFALEMAARHPQAVKAMIVHEPPVIRLLPDSKKWQRFFCERLSDLIPIRCSGSQLQIQFISVHPVQRFQDSSERFSTAGNGSEQ